MLCVVCCVTYFIPTNLGGKMAAIANAVFLLPETKSCVVRGMRRRGDQAAARHHYRSQRMRKKNGGPEVGGPRILLNKILTRLCCLHHLIAVWLLTLLLSDLLPVIGCRGSTRHALTRNMNHSIRDVLSVWLLTLVLSNFLLTTECRGSV